jgi:hypothetical protein
MELLNKPTVEALLHEFNGLATGLLRLRAKELGWLKTSQGAGGGRKHFSDVSGYDGSLKVK